MSAGALGAGGRAGGATTGVADAAGVAGAAGFTGAAGETGGTTGGLATGRATVCGVISRGAGAGGAGGFAAGGVLGGAAGAAAAGSLASSGGAAGRTGAGACAGPAGACCCFVISLSTSPGLEMCERSILVLISSDSRAARDERPAAVLCASADDRKSARSFSASCCSTELECVFFSVIPTSVSTSRIALLLTSSSLARSLIRILLIRPFPAPRGSLGLHSILTELALRSAPAAAATDAGNPDHCFGSAE